MIRTILSKVGQQVSLVARKLRRAHRCTACRTPIPDDGFPFCSGECAEDWAARVAY